MRRSVGRLPKPKVFQPQQNSRNYLGSGMHWEGLQGDDAGWAPAVFHVPGDPQHVIRELLPKDEVLDGGFLVQLIGGGHPDLQLGAIDLALRQGGLATLEQAAA